METLGGIKIPVMRTFASLALPQACSLGELAVSKKQVLEKGLKKKKKKKKKKTTTTKGLRSMSSAGATPRLFPHRALHLRERLLEVRQRRQWRVRRPGVQRGEAEDGDVTSVPKANRPLLLLTLGGPVLRGCHASSFSFFFGGG